MPALIQKNCTNCQICVPLCPTSSISMGLTHHIIDTDTCEECRVCVPICPVAAIELMPRANFPKEELPVAEEKVEKKSK